MTTDSPHPETKKRRFSAVDFGVGLLAICSLAAPFAARLQVEALASEPIVAVRADVSPVRPIDIELGYHEKKAEAAFFEGLDKPAVDRTDAALDLALAVPVTVPEPDVPAVVEDKPSDLPADMPSSDNADAAGLSLEDMLAETAKEPEAMLMVAVLVSPALPLDLAPDADTSDTPPEKVVEKPKEEAPEPPQQVRVIMSAPPTMTPFPVFDARNDVPVDVEVADISDAEIVVDASSAAYNEIEEAPLAPLPAPESLETTAIVDAAPISTGEALKIEALPSDVVSVVPEVIAPVVVAQNTLAPAPARPPVKLKNGPRIAIVIAAAGINTNVTNFAIEALPDGITLAFAPVKANVTELARAAKADGHSVLVEIPMEPVNRNRDPGPLTLRVEDTAQQNLSRLNQALSRVPMADGASSYLGARFNADERAAAPIVRALATKGLFLFENEPTTRSVFQRLSNGSALPYARGVVKIDRDRSGAAIRQALDSLEKQARRNGSAVGVGTALRGTISTVALWAKAAEKRGVQLVPIVELAR